MLDPVPSALSPQPGVGGVGGQGGRAVDVEASQGDRTYAMFMHLMLPIATFTVLPMVLGPLVMWLLRRDESRFVDDHGKEALNFHLSVLIYYVLSVVLGALTCGVMWAAVPLVWIFSNVFAVVAAVAANRGEWYRYPACVRLLG